MTTAIDVLTPAKPARASWGINHVLAYGQSLSCGWDGWPILSSTPRDDSLMLGQSVHPMQHDAPGWKPVGPARFHPLIATLRNLNDAQPLMQTPPRPGDAAIGETILETALNEWRGLALAAGLATLGQNRLLASSCGVGGRSLESLSAQAGPGLFSRLRACAETAQETAHAIGQTYGIAAFLFLQGESNNWGLDGASPDPAVYGALFRSLCQDFRHAAGDVTAQANPPVVFTYQTGGPYATDANPIPQCQLEAALEMPGVVMVSPIYYLPHTPSGHLDANGYRWLGAQFGKVMHRVLDRGEVFRPTHPVHAWCRDTKVTIAFHVPVAPLAWGQPYPGNPLATISGRGFVVSDEAGEIPIISVELAGAETVGIHLARPISGEAILSYASAATDGRGCLHDSDSSQSTKRYTLVSGPTDGFQTPAPELEGKPYQLRNWCAAFTIKIATAA